VKAQLQGALLMSLVPVDTVVTVASCTNDINNAVVTMSILFY
jgi:hypothetical protein